MMIETGLPYILGFFSGAGLGFFYFGGLWLTVKKIPVSSNPQRLFFQSAVLRLAPTLLALFFTARADPGIFIIMLPGFFGVRYCMIRRVSNLSREQVHAA